MEIILELGKSLFVGMAIGLILAGLVRLNQYKQKAKIKKLEDKIKED